MDLWELLDKNWARDPNVANAEDVEEIEDDDDEDDVVGDTVPEDPYVAPVKEDAAVNDAEANETVVKETKSDDLEGKQRDFEEQEIPATQRFPQSPSPEHPRDLSQGFESLNDSQSQEPEDEVFIPVQPGVGKGQDKSLSRPYTKEQHFELQTLKHFEQSREDARRRLELVRRGTVCSISVVAIL